MILFWNSYAFMIIYMTKYDSSPLMVLLTKFDEPNLNLFNFSIDYIRSTSIISRITSMLAGTTAVNNQPSQNLSQKLYYVQISIHWFLFFTLINLKWRLKQTNVYFDVPIFAVVYRKIQVLQHICIIHLMTWVKNSYWQNFRNACRTLLNSYSNACNFNIHWYV